jgi:hypothetical protein
MKNIPEAFSQARGLEFGRRLRHNLKMPFDGFSNGAVLLAAGLISAKAGHLRRLALAQLSLLIPFDCRRESQFFAQV